jgi:S-adenosylmethionine hydrolase
MGLIALLTDFGMRDGYVASMKAVIQSIAPESKVIDISHDISPQNIEEAGFVLWTAYRYFPRKTIFACVIDPGVGTKRNLIAVKTRDYLFLAPDNGLLDMVLSELEIKRSVRVMREKYFLKNVSNTFHGRDIIAPIASHMMKGVKLKSFGPSITIEKPKTPFQQVSIKGAYNGLIIYIDRFGNLVSNFKMNKPRKAELVIGNYRIPLQKAYGDAKKGEPLALVGSTGLVEIAVRDGSAKDLLHALYKTPVTLNVK